MKGKISLLLALVLSAGLYGQEEEPVSKNHTVRIGAGWNSYQIIPSQFALDNGDEFQVVNRRRSLIYNVEWTTGPAYSDVEYGLNLGYETSLSDLDGSSLLRDAYLVEHWSLIGVLYYPYFKRDYFSLGVSFLLGGGMDIGTFSDEGPNIDYVQYDYHYQIDPVVIRVGKDYGFELIGGYGVRGYVRGNIFLKF